MRPPDYLINDTLDLYCLSHDLSTCHQVHFINYQCTSFSVLRRTVIVLGLQSSHQACRLTMTLMVYSCSLCIICNVLSIISWILHQTLGDRYCNSIKRNLKHRISEKRTWNYKTSKREGWVLNLKKCSECWIQSYPSFPSQILSIPQFFRIRSQQFVVKEKEACIGEYREKGVQ